MFSKFKKFAIMFAFCMSIFGVTAFADCIGPDGTTYKYYLKVGQNEYFSNDAVYVEYKSALKSEYLVIENFYTYSSGVLTGGPYLSNTWKTSSLDWNTVYSNVKGIGSYTSGPQKPTPPILEGQTVGEAMEKIVPDLSKQLKVLLPVGVILLSTMLGVSLVRRLVPLFL